MLLELKDYIDRSVDPTAPFVPLTMHDELLEAAALDPSAGMPNSLVDDLATARVANALRLQQHIVYRIGAELGVLAPALKQVRNALQAMPLLSSAPTDTLVAEILDTGIGVAADMLAVAPYIGWLVRIARATAGLAIGAVEALSTPGTFIGPPLVDAQRYRTDADTSHANSRLLVQANTRDWTSLFQPAMRGKLGAQIRRDPGNRIVVAWGLRDDGIVPRVVIDDRPLTKPYRWHFSEENGNVAGRPNPFTETDGMAAVPGSSQIVSVTQSAMTSLQNLHRGHETLGDPRCGSDQAVISVNVGSWYPTTANGAASLFAYASKASASSYAIATQEVASAWQSYVDEIWEGIERLWRNESWEGGYGCGVWEAALQGLAQAHCVGAEGVIGGFGAWMPTRYEKRLTAADRNEWERNNLCTRIVKPAMMDLREMQLSLLRKTPMAAYLPGHGMGAFRDVSVKEAFDAARAKLLNGYQRADKLRLDDVVDDYYRRMLERQGRGSVGADGGIGPTDYKPPRLGAAPASGGRGAIVLVGGLAALAAAGLAIRARRRR